MVEYLGQFELDPEPPFYWKDAPETGGGKTRSVIVFRLRPVNGPASIRPMRVVINSSPVKSETVVTNVPIEEYNTERARIDPTQEPYEAERRESALVQRFKDYMQRQQHVVERKKIVPAGEARPIFTDVYVKDLNTLVEAKGSIDRNSIRMVIGQLLDYRRFVGNSSQVRRVASRSAPWRFASAPRVRQRADLRSRRTGLRSDRRPR
jgi:hypothetical protein